MDTRELIERLNGDILAKYPRWAAETATMALAALSSQAAEIERLREENAHLDRAAAAMSKNLFKVTAGNELATAEMERLKEALEPFALVAEYDIGETEADTDRYRPMTQHNSVPVPTVGDFRRVLAALSPKPNKEGE